jgi:hypothetical protein
MTFEGSTRPMFKLTVVFLSLAVLGIGGVAYANQDRGGPRAYTLVDPNGGSPRLIADHTSGFVGVNLGNQGQGDYCLTPSPGVDVVHTAAVAAEEAFYSFAVGIATVRYDPDHLNCSAGQLEVKTFTSAPGLSNQIAFTVNVP